MQNITENSTIHVTFAPAVGIEDETSQLISLHPNPTTGNVFLLNNGIEVLKLEVLDLAGSIVMELNDVADGFDISKLSNGTYTVRIHHKNGITVHRIVKKN
ncbi:hypothetical protein SDC9_168722 [bioreactor metagenome]|uniref:Secretion system C-terminal sorting domain-containing protein n=1 Tax=bioreactor metagenome TaxID=1076179 RepID=A0A645GBU4_9ZZZZ